MSDDQRPEDQQGGTPTPDAGGPAERGPSAGGNDPTQPIPPTGSDPAHPVLPAPGGPTQPIPSQSSAPQAQGGARRLWREATATTGARVATILALALAVVVVLGGVTAAVVAVTHLDHRNGPMMDDRGARGPGFSGPGGEGRGGGTRGPGGEGDGSRGLGPLTMGPSGALHGEVTDGRGTTYVFQRGEVTASSTSSLSLRSSDGFTGTYAITSDTRVVGRGSGVPAKGATAYVLATKDGNKAVLVRSGGARASGAGTGAGADGSTT